MSMGFVSNTMTFLPVCPHCFSRKMTFYLACEREQKIEVGTLAYISFWVCGGCQHGVVGESLQRANISSGSNVFEFKNFTKLYPELKPLQATPFTPKRIAETYVTAMRILREQDKGLMTQSDLEMCCIAARKAVELAVNELGAQGHNLYQKIENLADQGIITNSLREWAHEIRMIGNDGAHEDGEVTYKDAEQAIFFADMLFHYLYTLPGMIAERKSRR